MHERLVNYLIGQFNNTETCYAGWAHRSCNLCPEAGTRAHLTPHLGKQFSLPFRGNLSTA